MVGNYLHFESCAQCEAMCTATRLDANASNTDECAMYGFKRAAPFSYTDQTGWCYLMHSKGACKVDDFAVALFARYRIAFKPTL